MDIFSKEMLYAGGAWVRPNLTSNGILGGNSFAVSGFTDAWKCVDNSDSTYCLIPRNQTYTFYNPTPLNVTLVNFIFTGTGSVSRASSGQASNDGSSWTNLNYTYNANNQGVVKNISINITNNNFYKYYRFSIYTTPSSGVNVTDIQITAKEQ